MDFVKILLKSKFDSLCPLSDLNSSSSLPFQNKLLTATGFVFSGETLSPTTMNQLSCFINFSIPNRCSVHLSQLPTIKSTPHTIKRCSYRPMTNKTSKTTATEPSIVVFNDIATGIERT